MGKSVLVIGLGSMGKRRIRNLKALGIEDIVGFDLRADRRIEAEDLYGVTTVSFFEAAIEEHRFDAFIISLPPDVHHIYMKKAVALKIPAFIEASVVDTDLQQIIRDANDNHVLMAPSCTLSFHPAIKNISAIVKSGTLGVISNFIYHSGQYLPDWHTYEEVSDYYVSNKVTGGGREIVPFELTWITILLGFPKRIVGFYKKSIDIKGAEEIDDTYNLLMDYGNSIFNLSVDVVSRYATRRLLINGDQKQLFWNWDDTVIRIFHPESDSWEEITYNAISAQDGYNKNITEQMYIDEIQAFINAVDTGEGYPNTLEHDLNVLKLLYAVEKSDHDNQIKTFL